MHCPECGTLRDPEAAGEPERCPACGAECTQVPVGRERTKETGARKAAAPRISGPVRIGVLLLALVLAVASVVAVSRNKSHANRLAGQPRQQEIMIPMPQAGASGLQALLVYYPASSRQGLVVLSHGSPRNSALRAQMTPYDLLPQALEFARRGWLVAIVMRRGYGNSGGAWAESFGACGNAQYLAAGQEASLDLRTAMEYLSGLPQVDGSRILAVGVSAGGFATTALTAHPPPGLVAAISFAGGRGSVAPDTVCDENALVEAYRSFGASATTPMLWVYAQNDHFFGPRLAQRLLEVFEQGGDKVRFVQPESFGEDGHDLFSAQGAPVWTPIVDAFLASQKLNRGAAATTR